MLLDSLGNKPGSWVIVRLADNKSIIEIFNPDLLPMVNAVKYKVMPIYDYLANLNRSIKQGVTI